jgi:hypothetical protein
VEELWKAKDLSGLRRFARRIVIPAIDALRHPGQAKREPGSQKKQTFRFVTVPDNAFGVSGMTNEGHPLASLGNSA